MKKLYFNLTLGIAVTILIYGIFFVCQYSLAQSFEKKQEIAADTINKETFHHENQELLQSLEVKVDLMEKYVNDSQKNLDLWLKLLAFILSVLIGYSVFAGLRTRELAKDELAEIRRTRDEITRQANDAEDRLKAVTEQITQIENTAAKAKLIEDEMTKHLNELVTKEGMALNEAQLNTLNETIAKAKEDLQSSGIETLKNLYFAKSIKAYNEKNWDEVIRLLINYIDLDDNNEKAFNLRGWTYVELWRKVKTDSILIDKAFADLNMAVKLDPNYYLAYNNRAVLYHDTGDYSSALKDYTEAIRLNPNYILGYKNRALLHSAMGNTDEQKKDNDKAIELEASNVS
jgi:tetratricopeptide (TPR) repeat protein